jgi:hypothetical protein
MHGRVLRVLAASLAIGASGSVAAEARADDGPKIDAALQQAAKLEKAGKTADAHAKLDEAWAMGHRWDVAAALGMNEKKSGDFAHSAQHLEYAIRFFPDSVKQDARQAYIDAFTEVRSKVAALRLRLLPDASGVRIDGDTPESLGIDYDVFVMPGSHRVEMPNHASQILDTKADASYTLTAEDPGVMARAPGDETARPAGSPAPAHSSRSPVPAVLLGIVAAGGAGVGIGFTVVAQKKSDDATDIAASATCASRDVSGAPSARCVAQGSSAVSDHNTFQAVGIAGFVGCGLALGGTLMYALWPSSDARVQAAIDPVDGGGYLAVGRSF